MDEVLISWSVANWITICLMVFLGYAIVCAARQAYMSRTAGDAAAK